MPKRLSTVRDYFAALAFITSLLAMVPAHAQTSACDLAAVVHRNIVVLGFPCVHQTDESVVPTLDGVDKIIQALELLYTESPQTFATIEDLKQGGPVIIIYDPAYPPPGVHLTTIQIALFLPTFFNQFDPTIKGKQFTAIVGRDGIKWPESELATVLAQ